MGPTTVGMNSSPLITPPGSNGKDVGGCGCVVGGHAPTRAPTLAAFALLALALLRRRAR
jgi:MYXO-CTERM domain-containing protein